MIPNPWVLLGAGVAYVLIAIGAFFYGGHVREAEIKAAQTETAQKQLADFKAGVNGMIKDAAHDAFAEFDARNAILKATADQLQHLAEVQSANGQALSAALRGRFVLSPAERVQLECLRRPDDPRCATASVPTTVSGQVGGAGTAARPH